MMVKFEYWAGAVGLLAGVFGVLQLLDV